MTTYTFGNPNASTVLIQLVGDHDLDMLQQEAEMIKERSDTDFQLIAVKVNDWNKDLPPWKAPAVFGTEGFGEGAERTLKEVRKLCSEPDKEYYLGGYSLAGLFALWASYETDVFKGIAAVSPSVWYPGFMEHMKARNIKTQYVYLSLGDKEEKTRNRVMAAVGECIREAEVWLTEQKVNCILEWNQGNHFRDSELRMAKGYAWLLQHEPHE